MINPLVVYNTTMHVAIRQYAEQETWRHQCGALGVSGQQIILYEERALAFAATTIYPNSDVVCYLRMLALEALKRGEPMPTDPKQTIEAEDLRQMARLIDGLRPVVTPVVTSGVDQPPLDVTAPHPDAE